MAEIHPFYEVHRGTMEASMHQRLDIAEATLRSLTWRGSGGRVLDEFEIVLTQMPYVGGATSCMSDFFMRLSLPAHADRRPKIVRPSLQFGLK